VALTLFASSSTWSRSASLLASRPWRRTLGTTKSRIFRHLQTLVMKGYLSQQEETERYQVGHGLTA